MIESSIQTYHPLKYPAGRSSLWSRIGMPARGRGLHELIKSGAPFEIIAKLADATGMNQVDIAKSLGISQKTVTRRQAAGRLTSEESDRLYRLLKLLDAAVELFEGDTTAAKEWLEAPAVGLSGLRPIEMTASTAETDAVLDLVARLELGGSI